MGSGLPVYRVTKMIFSRIIYSAILIGIVTGALLSCLQILGVNPIIFAAETYEIVDAETDGKAVHDHADQSPGHSHEAWAPEDGAERTAYTFLSNMSASIGFAAIMLAIMALFWLPKKRRITWTQGSLWGLAGFTALYLAPGIGLPPEIPGVLASPIEHRQIWWTLTALSVAIGLGVIAFSAVKFKFLGLPFLAIPYIVGAPHNDGPLFGHPDPTAVSALTELHQQFILTSGITNLVFWLILGLACTFAFNRWFRKVELTDDYAAA
jgi:cobalt transporter subunit CbtA